MTVSTDARAMQTDGADDECASMLLERKRPREDGSDGRSDDDYTADGYCYDNMIDEAASDEEIDDGHEEEKLGYNDPPPLLLFEEGVRRLVDELGVERSTAIEVLEATHGNVDDAAFRCLEENLSRRPAERGRIAREQGYKNDEPDDYAMLVEEDVSNQEQRSREHEELVLIHQAVRPVCWQLTLEKALDDTLHGDMVIAKSRAYKRNGKWVCSYVYAAVAGVRGFFDCREALDKNDRVLNEVQIGETASRVHFDYEKDALKKEQINDSGMQVIYDRGMQAPYILACVEDVIHFMADKYDITLRPADVVVLNASISFKLSCHILLPFKTPDMQSRRLFAAQLKNHAMPAVTRHEARASFVEEVLVCLDAGDPLPIRPSDIDSCEDLPVAADLTIYSRNRVFRSEGCNKMGKKNHLEVVTSLVNPDTNETVTFMDPSPSGGGLARLEATLLTSELSLSFPELPLAINELAHPPVRQVRQTRTAGRSGGGRASLSDEAMDLLAGLSQSGNRPFIEPSDADNVVLARFDGVFTCPCGQEHGHSGNRVKIRVDEGGSRVMMNCFFTQKPCRRCWQLVGTIDVVAPAEEWEKDREVYTAYRDDGVTLACRPFAPTLENNRAIVDCSPMSSGKSHQVVMLIKDFARRVVEGSLPADWSALVIIHRKALAEQFYKLLRPFGFKLYNDCDAYIEDDRVVCTIHSLERLQKQTFDLVVVDEFPEVVNTLCNPHRGMYNVNVAFTRILSAATKLVFMSAHADSREHRFLNRLNIQAHWQMLKIGPRLNATFVNFRPSEKASNAMPLDEVVTYFGNRIQAGEHLAIGFCEVNTLETIVDGLRGRFPEKTFLTVHARLDDEKKRAALEEAVNGFYDVLAFTTVMGTGFSVETFEHYSACAYVENRTLDAGAIVQMLGRSRYPAPGIGPAICFDISTHRKELPGYRQVALGQGDYEGCTELECIQSLKAVNAYLSVKGERDVYWWYSEKAGQWYVFHRLEELPEVGLEDIINFKMQPKNLDMLIDAGAIISTTVQKMCMDHMKRLCGTDPNDVYNNVDMNLLMVHADHIKKRLNLARDMVPDITRLMRLDGREITRIDLTPPDEDKEEQKLKRDQAKALKMAKKAEKIRVAERIWEADDVGNDRAVLIGKRIQGGKEVVTQNERDSLVQAHARYTIGRDFWTATGSSYLSGDAKVTLLEPKFQAKFALAGYLTDPDVVSDLVARREYRRSRVDEATWVRIGLASEGGSEELRNAALMKMITDLGFTSHLDFDTRITLTTERRDTAVENAEYFRKYNETAKKNAPALVASNIHSNICGMINSVIPVKFTKVAGSGRNGTAPVYKLSCEIEAAPIPSYEKYEQYNSFRAGLARCTGA
jgi:hypothetical protein